MTQGEGAGVRCVSPGSKIEGRRLTGCCWRLWVCRVLLSCSCFHVPKRNRGVYVFAVFRERGLATSSCHQVASRFTTTWWVLRMFADLKLWQLDVVLVKQLAIKC